MALEPSGGRTAVPVRSSLIGIAVAVLGVVAIVVFSASLDGLLDTPRAYGTSWDARLGDLDEGFEGQPCGPVDTPFSDDPDIGAIGNACFLSITLDERAIGAVGLSSMRGSIQPTVLEGRAPDGVDEVALGSETLQALGKDIGDEVTGQSPAGRFVLTVVGRVVVPFAAETQSVADGAVFTGDGLRQMYDDGNVSGGSSLLVRFEPGIDPAEVTQRIEEAGWVISIATVPLEVARLQQANRLPAALAAFLAALGAIAVGHLLVTSVHRRRADFAILKSLGFRRSQLSWVVGVQATTVACVGLALGLIPGVAAGGALWRAAAGSIGVLAEVDVPIELLAGIAAVTVVIANVVAAVPARTAARTRPAELLGGE